MRPVEVARSLVTIFCLSVLVTAARPAGHLSVPSGDVAATLALLTTIHLETHRPELYVTDTASGDDALELVRQLLVYDRESHFAYSARFTNTEVQVSLLRYATTAKREAAENRPEPQWKRRREEKWPGVPYDVTVTNQGDWSAGGVVASAARGPWVLSVYASPRIDRERPQTVAEVPKFRERSYEATRKFLPRLSDACLRLRVFDY